MTHLFKVEDAAWGDIVGCNVPSLEIVYYQDRDLMQPQRSQPPINNNLLPRREGRLEPQKRHRPSHLFRLCSPPHRRTLHPLPLKLHQLLPRRPHHPHRRRPHEARRHSIHTHLHTHQLRRQRLHQRMHRRLGRRVHAHPRDAHLIRYRGGKDNRPAGCDHRREFLRGEVRPEDVCVDGAAEGSLRDVCEGLQRGVARVDEEEIDCAAIPEEGRGCLDEGVDGCYRGDVAGEDFGGGAELGLRGADGVRAAARDEDFGAVGVEELGGCEADAVAAANDEGCFVCVGHCGYCAVWLVG